MGTQMHATDNFRRVVELVRGGAIGTPQDVRVWCSRTPAGGSYLPDADKYVRKTYREGYTLNA
jgi:hypothetical protein